MVYVWTRSEVHEDVDMSYNQLMNGVMMFILTGTPLNCSGMRHGSLQQVIRRG